MIVEQQPPNDGGVAATWTRYWFKPADPRPLAVVRILTAALGLALLWSYAGDLQAWFGPRGMIPADGSAAWRSRFSVSVFDLATTSASLWAAYAATAVAFTCLLVGLFTPVAAVAAAVLWASLLHRGPMLAGAADDCLAVLLWCLAVGPCGEAFSLDAVRRGRSGQWSWPVRVSLGLVQVHVAAIAAAAVLAQLKGDAWWDGTAAWWLAVRPAGRLVDLTLLYARSEYLMNLITHAIVAFEVVFAAGLWFTVTQQPLARAGLVAWPLIGLLAGEPLWGCAMAIFCVPLAVRSDADR